MPRIRKAPQHARHGDRRFSLRAIMSEKIGERHASACRYKNEVPEGSRPMALSLMLDSLTRSVSEGILGENKQPTPLAIHQAATNDTFSRFWKATDPRGVQAVRYLFPCDSFGCPTFGCLPASHEMRQPNGDNRMDKIAGNTSVQKPGALLHAVGIGALNGEAPEMSLESGVA